MMPKTEREITSVATNEDEHSVANDKKLNELCQEAIKTTGARGVVVFAFFDSLEQDGEGYAKFAFNQAGEFPHGVEAQTRTAVAALDAIAANHGQGFGYLVGPKH